MDLEEEKEGKTENGSFRNTTHSGKCHDAFHGVKTGLRNTVSIIVRELSIEWNKKEGEEEKKKASLLLAAFLNVLWNANTSLINCVNKK